MGKGKISNTEKKYGHGEYSRQLVYWLDLPLIEQVLTHLNLLHTVVHEIFIVKIFSYTVSVSEIIFSEYLIKRKRIEANNIKNLIFSPLALRCATPVF